MPPKLNVAEIEGLAGEAKTFSKGIYERVEAANIPDRIVSIKNGIPKLIKIAGTGAAATVIGAYSIGFAGKKIGQAMQATGLRDKSAADILNENLAAIKTATELAKQNNVPYTDMMYLGRNPLSEYGNNALYYNRGGQTPLTSTPQQMNILSAGGWFLGLLAVAGAGVLTFIYVHKQIKKK